MPFDNNIHYNLKVVRCYSPKEVIKMAKVFKLSIDPNYVPSWGLVEGVRELFQNALDQEKTNNKEMFWSYSEENQELTIGNKDSSIEIQTLLLGNTSKSDDGKTIGKWGEGYKVGKLALLRAEHPVKFLMQKKNTVWEPKFTHSRDYGCKILSITVTNVRQAGNDLIMKVGNITHEQMELLKERNLHMREEGSFKCRQLEDCRVLTDPEECGNVYVNGLFVKNIKELAYGYDFPPRIIPLDRDRSMVSDLDIQWETSELWLKIADNNELYDMIKTGVPDVRYVSNRINIGVTIGSESSKSDNIRKIADTFIAEHGENAVPVTSTEEYEAVKEEGLDPVVVSSAFADTLKATFKGEPVLKRKESLKRLAVRIQLREWLDSVKDRLSKREFDEAEDLIDQVEN
jgi:hypothetical protein